MNESFVSKVWFAMISAVALLLVACGDAGTEGSVGEEQLLLTAPTQVSTFAFLASGQLSMRDRGQVTGGNVGVAGGAVNGANSITTGFDCRLGIGNGVIGRRMSLGTRTAAGDLFVTQLLASGATFTSQSAFSAPPASPPIVAFTAGTTALTVNSGQTVTRAAGNFGLVTVNGTLRLSGGIYQFQNLVLGNGGVLQPTAPSIVRVAGRVTGGDRVRLLPAAPLNASALRLIVAGANDTNGGVSLGIDGQMAALVVSRASFRTGDRFIGSGAIAASNIDFGFDLRFTFNTGFACNSNAGCNDNNACSTDTCTDAQCLHPNVANGTTCTSDNNACTNDRCTNGTCLHPAVPNGSACTLPNASGLCSGGACGLRTCNAGFGDCDIDPSNGCETNVLIDESNCGQCGAACFVQNGVQACSNGTCSGDVIECFDGFGDCDVDPTNGCETDLTVSESNCGQCGAACFVQNGVQACSNSTCSGDVIECFDGFGDCDVDPSNGCETDITVSESNCGQCGAACFVQNGVAACANGLCTDSILQCFGDFADCDLDPSNGCETDLSFDTFNCGQCGATCSVPNAAAFCSNGVCGIGTCNDGFDNCDNNVANGCESDLTSAAACGGCGNACTFVNDLAACTGGTCEAGACSDKHPHIVKKDGGVEVTLTGFSTAPLDVVEVSVLTDQTKNPGDCAVQQNNALWLDLTPNGLSAATPAFDRAFPPPFTRVSFYPWTITLTVPAQFWPQGGLARLRIIGGGAAFEDDPAVVIQDPTQSCVANNPEERLSFEALVDRCAGASIYKVCPNQIGTRQIVTELSPDPVPAVPPPPYCNLSTLTDSKGGKLVLGHFVWDKEPNLAPGCNYGAEIDQYYTRVNPSTGQRIDPLGYDDTLELWKGRNGFPATVASDEAHATYYNAGDIGIGRDMHCRKNAPNGAAATCYVTNYGPSFGDDPVSPSDALQLAIDHSNGTPGGAAATVAMEYWPGQPDPVRFFVFDGDLTGGPHKLLPTVVLDGEGAKPVPGVCLSCHGGNYRASSAAGFTGEFVPDANFLPFDPCSFTFSSSNQNFSLHTLEPQFRQLNQLVLDTIPRSRNGRGIEELIKGMYGDQLPEPPDPQLFPVEIDKSFVPAVWKVDSGHKRLYEDVVKPYCRSCHISQQFQPTPSLLQLELASNLLRTCDHKQPTSQADALMPHAQKTYERYWESSARTVLVNAYDTGFFSGIPPTTGQDCAP